MDYRLYFFDAAGIHITAAVPLEAEHDAAAIGAAEEYHANGSKMELWEHARLVRDWFVDEAVLRTTPVNPASDRRIAGASRAAR